MRGRVGSADDVRGGSLAGRAVATGDERLLTPERDQGLRVGSPAVASGGFGQAASIVCGAESVDRTPVVQRRAEALAWLRDLAAGPAPSPCTVKLCGLTREVDADAAMAAGADLLGFVCDVPSSRRSVSPARLAELCAHVRCAAGATGPGTFGCDLQGVGDAPDTSVAPTAADPRSVATAMSSAPGLRTAASVFCPPNPAWCVGVFVDEPVERLVGLLAGEVGPDLVQLHGSEDAAYIAELREGLARAGCGQVGVIQAFRVRDAGDVARANASTADLVLLDAGAGCGSAFDWSLAGRCTRAFALAGGLGPHNLAQAVRQVRPWCVDMSSGVETGGVKDSKKMLAAVHAVRSAGKDE